MSYKMKLEGCIKYINKFIAKLPIIAEVITTSTVSVAAVKVLIVVSII